MKRKTEGIAGAFVFDWDVWRRFQEVRRWKG
jgi:hypothetical protein